MLKIRSRHIWIIFLCLVILILIIYLFSKKNKHVESFLALPIDECYPPVTLEFLKQYEKYDEISKYFEVDKILNPLPFYDKVISVSLFCKNVDNTYENERDSPDSSKNSAWYKKYMQSLIDNLNSYENTEYFKQKFKIRIHLANDLATHEYIDLLSRDFVEIYVMKTSSIGAQPGMMWRYLPYSDKSITLISVLDIDSPFDETSRFISAFNNYPNHIMLKSYNKPTLITGPTDPNNTDVVTNAVILGGQHMVRPKLLNIDISNVMESFIRYRMDKAESDTPNFYGDNASENVCNKPVGNHKYGFGGHWFVYGFDEGFLRHVMFYYIVNKGGMVTLYDKKVLDEYPEERDYSMAANKNNIFIEQ